MWTPSESSSKRFVFEYLSQNALMLNEVSHADAISYLISALEIERLNGTWYNLALKALFEVLYASCYLSFAFASKTCVSEVLHRHLIPYISNAIEVSSRLTKPTRLCKYFLRYRVRISDTGAVVCFPCYRKYHLGKLAVFIEVNCKDCDHWSEKGSSSIEELQGVATCPIFSDIVTRDDPAAGTEESTGGPDHSQIRYHRKKEQ